MRRMSFSDDVQKGKKGGRKREELIMSGLG